METAHSVDIKKVAIAMGEEGIQYPSTAPYLPSEEFPELLGKVPIKDDPNKIYPLIRNLFYDYGLDHKNFNSPVWNPLGSIISPGQKVLIKPNLVRHLHMAGGDFNAVVTHASVIRCVLDYVAKALNGYGEIIVGDAPVQSAHFPTLLKKTGLDIVCESVSSQWQIPIRLLDFRLVTVEMDKHHCIIQNEKKQGDPGGYVSVNLGQASMLHPLRDSFQKFRVTSYDCSEMVKHHNFDRHEYLIPKSVLSADVVINMPKLKTHRKVGLTGALKNLVGINGHKDWLPHHRCGSLLEGGDEYRHPSILKKAQNLLHSVLLNKSCSYFSTALHFGIRVLNRLALKFCRDQFKEGSWYGNDTAWRMVLDLNRLLIYSDKEGKMLQAPQRRVFTIVDAIVAGDGEGPMEPNARDCGIIVCGANQLAVDTVLATLAGFDYKKISMIFNGYKPIKWKIANFEPHSIEILADKRIFADLNIDKSFSYFCFSPPEGWKGQIEFKECVRQN